MKKWLPNNTLHSDGRSRAQLNPVINEFVHETSHKSRNRDLEVCYPLFLYLRTCILNTGQDVLIFNRQ